MQHVHTAEPLSLLPSSEPFHHPKETLHPCPALSPLSPQPRQPPLCLLSLWSDDSRDLTEEESFSLCPSVYITAPKFISLSAMSLRSIHVVAHSRLPFLGRQFYFSLIFLLVSCLGPRAYQVSAVPLSSTPCPEYMVLSGHLFCQ